MPHRTATLEEQAHRIFEAVDAMDAEAMGAMITEDAQGVDELSRGWLRGRDALRAYFSQLEDMVDHVHSELNDVHTTEWGDAGVVTCVVAQTYEMGDERQRLTAPTSLTLRRENGEWKIAVFHSVPLPG